MALLHQQHRSAALDLARDLAMQMCRHPRHPTWEDFTAFSYEFLEQIRVFVINRFRRKIDPAPRHRPIGATERRATLRGFRLHALFSFAMQRVPAQKRIVFLLLQTIRCVGAFLVARRYVARRRLAFGFCLGALKSDNVARHPTPSRLPSPLPRPLPPQLNRTEKPQVACCGRIG
jgi:hypothetical protein